MTEPTSRQGASYPAAPWRATGQLWIGLYDAGVRLVLPPGLQPLANPNWVILTLVRYLQGILRYDELVIGSLVRRGRRVGVHVRSIWVDDEASLWGGRRIWGLPKELATFAWHGERVRVEDEHGAIVTLTVNGKAAQGPWLRLVAPGFGLRDSRCLYTLARLQARVTRSGMRVEDWSGRFSYRVAGTPVAGFAANPMRITVPEPRVLED